MRLESSREKLEEGGVEKGRNENEEAKRYLEKKKEGEALEEKEYFDKVLTEFRELGGPAAPVNPEEVRKPIEETFTQFGLFAHSTPSPSNDALNNTINDSNLLLSEMSRPDGQDDTNREIGERGNDAFKEPEEYDGNLLLSEMCRTDEQESTNHEIGERNNDAFKEPEEYDGNLLLSEMSRPDILDGTNHEIGERNNNAFKERDDN